MGEYSKQEAAERAGVSVEELTRMLELEMLGRHDDAQLTSGDIRKIGLVRDLSAAGLPLEALAAEIKTGRLALDFLDNPAFDMFSALSKQTLENLSATPALPPSVGTRPPRTSPTTWRDSYNGPPSSTAGVR